MSSDPPTDTHSSPADEPDAAEPALSQIVAARGEPLLEALEAGHPGSLDRANATGSYALAVAVGLGFSREEAELCRQTARLADIGRIYGADHLFESGAQLALGAGVPEVACEWLAQAGENYDGSGPLGLAGAEIPVFSRIVRAAKAGDSIASEPGTSAADVKAALRDMTDTELDPAMVHALVAMLESAGA